MSDAYRPAPWAAGSYWDPVVYQPPKQGQRFDDPDSAWVLEWTDGAWTPVCAVDNVAMTARTGRYGMLTCQACGKPAQKVTRR